MKQIVALLIVLFLVPFTASAQDFCEGNLDYDDDQDGSDAFTFKTDFGRSPFGNPCPPDGPAPVPKTGLTLCYDESGTVIVCAGTGQDGENQRGVASPVPRFTDNEDGTIKDNLTGLLWLKNANCFGQRAWVDAISDCNGLASGSCGLTDGSNAGDWRLPHAKELQSLIDFNYVYPALPSGHPFTNVVSFYYWSSTAHAEGGGYAWVLYMYNGEFYYGDMSNITFVWPVRGGH